MGCRVVLVGDAAYRVSPMSGQGTSIALIGAYVLAGELATAPGAYPTAFAEFEKVMRPFIEANQALGLKSAKLMRSGGTEVRRQLATQSVDADHARPHDGMDHQSIHRADQPGG